MDAKLSILLVDDDPDIAELVLPAVKKAGYRAKNVRAADDAFALLKKESVDLILLDFELPGISGMKFLEILKETPQTAALPVIMLTVRSEEHLKVQGLKIGADDYLTKPFSTKELLARIEALLRRVRRAGQIGNAVEAGGFRIDLDRKEVTVNGNRIKLTVTEFDLLALLVKHKGYVLSYRTLTDTLGQVDGKEMLSHSLYTHVKNIREKLGSQGDRIETVHGTGYKFIDA